LHRGYLAANVPIVVAYYLLPRYHLWTWAVLGLGASGAVFVGAIINRPSRRWPWFSVALGLATFVAGDTTYNVLTQYFHEVNPFPSIADGFYLVTYPLLAAGLLGMIRARRREKESGPLLDALVVTAGCALLSWMYLIHPYVHAHDMTFLQRAFSVAYPLGDILILAVLARLLSGGGARNPSLALLTGGAVGLLAADCVYGYIQLHGNWKVGGRTDIGWVVFYCFWGAAALHPSMRNLTEVQPRRDKQLSAVTLLILSAVTLVAPILTVWRVLVDGNTQYVAVSGITSAVIFMLVMARLTGLAGSLAGNGRRESALRLIGERLVVASGLADVFAAAVDGAQRIVPRLEACLVTETDSRGELIMASDHHGWAGQEVKVDETGVEVVGAELAPEIRWTVLPLVGRVPRNLVVGVAHGLPADTLTALEALAAQLALASERVELAHELSQRRSEQRFRSLIQSASDVILVIQPDGRLRSETPSLFNVLGYDSEMLENRHLDDFLHPGDGGRALAAIQGLLAHSREGPIRAQWRFRHADGRWLDMEVIGNDLSGDPHVNGIVLTMRDVSDRLLLEAELRHQAFHDSLTNLPNRAMFRDRVDHALSRRPRSQNTVAVLLIDVDDFKLVNDTLGHGAGDDLLIEVSRRLVRSLRREDTPSRLGGDEFAVCASFDAGTRIGVAELAQRIVDAFVEPCTVANTQFRVAISMGVSIAQDESRNSADMLREADLALYAAKKANKGSFQIFEPGLRQAVLARLERRNQLEEALEEGDMRLLYQPIVRLDDRRIVGLEALVRWEHKSYGLIPPVEFIEIAEESGLIIPLGRWVLERACRDLHRWQESQPQLRMSVNVSPRQLQSPDFLDTVDEVIAAHGVSPSSLAFEITETALVEDSDAVLQRLSALRARGITLALDDFGTGYSSLGYLHRFPVQVLKIDRSFVAGMDSADGLAVLDAIVAMAGSLHLDLVAEGIEDEVQLLRLQSLGCPTGQGYLFSRPVSVEAIDRLFELEQTALPRPLGGNKPSDRSLVLVPGTPGPAV